MPTPSKIDFRRRITGVLSRFWIEANAIDSVCEAYNEKWRDYHSSRHILGMLHKAVRLPLPINDRWLLSLLIIYHDAWYKIGREPGENERLSAEWATNDLRFYEGDRDVLFSLMRQGIVATTTHTLEGVDPQFVQVVSHLLDLDLWGLGQPAIRFQQDTEAVWNEFKPRYTRAEFDQGRSAWAATFLKRTWVYHTASFRPYEESAHDNLRALADTKYIPPDS